MLRALAILLLSSVLILTAVLLDACGGGHAQTRFVAAVPDAPNVDFLVDGTTQAANLAFPSANSGYVTISSGNHTVEVRAAGSTSDLVNASNVDFINRDQYTVLFTGLVQPPSGTPSQTVNQVPDDNNPPASGDVKLRFFHASPCAGDSTCKSPQRLDFYVVPPGTDITNLPPNIGSLAYQQASSYLNPAASSYEIIVTPAAGKKTLGYPDQTFAFSAGQIRTFVVVDVPHTSPPPPQFQISPIMMELSDLN